MASSPVTIGRFEVIETIGQGGMGTLFLAHDPMLDRRVAIKLLKEDDDELRERFAREARSAARLHHANIVTIFDVGEHEGRPFIAMEYVEGQTLSRIIKERQPLPTPRRLELIEELCEGLSYAHKAGIVHRDVKPANVMVDTEGSVKILDFGIARAKESSRLTRAGMLVGTLNYMSPEQVTGAAVDHRSDIFAVGLVLYEVLAYQKAFPGKALTEVLDRIVKGAPEPLGQVRRGLDPEVIRIVQRAIEKDPAGRYDNLRAMRKDLQAVRLRLDTANEPTQPFRLSDLQDVAPRTSPTPTPSGTSRERQEEALRRAREITGHLNAAHEAFARQDYEAAAAACERALALDEKDRSAIDLRERAQKQLAAQRREAERREAEQLERERAEAAQREAERQEAERLERERAEAAQREAERQEAERLERERAEAARREAERQEAERLERERQARQQRIVAGVATARETFAKGAFGDGLETLRALGKTEGDAPEIAQAIADGERQQEAARIAREVEAHLDRARKALSDGALEEADAAVRGARALDRRHDGATQFAREVTDAIRAEKKRRRDAERQARQQEKRIAALLKKAGKAKTHDAAIAALGELLTIEPDHAQAKQWLEERRTAKAADAAAGSAPEGHGGRDAAAGAGVPPARAATAAAARASAEIRRLALLAQAETTKLAARVQTWGGREWGLAGGALGVLAVGAYVTFGRGGAPARLPTIADTGVRVSNVFMPPGDRLVLSQLGLGPAGPRPVPTEAPPPPPPEPTQRVVVPPPEPEVVPPPDDPTEPPPAADPRVAQLRQRAAAEYARGERAAALATVDELLALDPRDAETYAWLAPIQQEAYDRAFQARRDADAAGPVAQQSPDYFTAASLQARASERSEAREFTDAIRDWWQATTLFEQAEGLARSASVEVDMDAVSRVIDQYRVALEALDVDGVRRVFPDVDVPALRSEFLSVTRQRIEIRDCRVIASTATSASVRCSYTNVAEMADTRRERTTRGEITLMMRREDERWIIAGRQ